MDLDAARRGGAIRAVTPTRIQRKLCVGGEFYDVLEHMGYQPSTGYYAKRVRWEKGVRVAVAKSLRGPWRFWTQVDVWFDSPHRGRFHLGSGR